MSSAARAERPPAAGQFGRLVRSTAFRGALVYLGLFGASAAVLLGFLYWSTAGFMARQTDAAIEAEISGLAEQYTQRGVIGLVRALDRRAARARARRGLYLLADAARRPLAGNLTAWPAEAPDAQGWLTFRLDYADARGAVDFGRARVFVLDGGLRLLVGRDIRERLEIVQRLRDSLGWGLALAFALSLAGGFLASRSMLRRIDAIGAASREIMVGELERRIPLRGTGDELDRLAENLNAMLDRIALLVAGMREVSDNIAHDLRSPLARLRSRLELVLESPADGADYRGAIERSIAEADSLLATFNALLGIARLEAGAERARFAPFPVDALLADVAELYAPVAEAKGVALTCAPGGAPGIEGDRDLVFQCVANLVDNAVRFSSEGGEITLTSGAAPDGGRVEIVVGDRGPGIPDALKPRVFERFFRVEPARAGPGSGLGLSLAAAVARRHGGALDLEDNHPGLRAVLRLPRPSGA